MTKNIKNMMEYAVGNLKIGKDTLIFNMGSAHNCPSKRLGLCNIDCYALKSEKRYPATYPYRTRQEAYWLRNDAFKIAEDIQVAFNRKLKTPLKYVRINESGDLHSADCVNKLIRIAEILPNIMFYTYTHRSDLIYNNMVVPKNLIINCSNFRRDGFNTFQAVSSVKVHRMADIPKCKKEILKFADYACFGDCSKCGYCKKAHGKVIGCPIH
jgi:hypothetical protein